nr:Uncharacterized protein A9P81_0884 [Leptospira interrogans serovar Copenhageni/Icterohaemorrhagiae]
MDWGKELSYDGVCVPNKNSIPLPPNAEAALNKTRVSSLNAWRELFSYLKSQNVPILAISIPFRPDFEKKNFDTYFNASLGIYSYGRNNSLLEGRRFFV